MNKTKQIIGLLIMKDYVKRPDEFPMVLKNLMVNNLFALMGDECKIKEVNDYKWHLKYLLNDLAFLLSVEQIESRHVKKILEDAWGTLASDWDLCRYLVDTKVLEEASGNDLAEIVARVIEGNAKAKEDILKGKKKAVGFLLGQIMKEAKGKASPDQVKEGIEKYIAELA